MAKNYEKKYKKLLKQYEELEKKHKDNGMLHFYKECCEEYWRKGRR